MDMNPAKTTGFGHQRLLLPDIWGEEGFKMTKPQACLSHF